LGRTLVGSARSATSYSLTKRTSVGVASAKIGVEVATNSTGKCRICLKNIPKGTAYLWARSTRVCSVCIETANEQIAKLIASGKVESFKLTEAKRKKKLKDEQRKKAAWRRNFRKYCKHINDLIEESPMNFVGTNASQDSWVASDHDEAHPLSVAFSYFGDEHRYIMSCWNFPIIIAKVSDDYSEILTTRYAIPTPERLAEETKGSFFKNEHMKPKRLIKVFNTSAEAYVRKARRLYGGRESIKKVITLSDPNADKALVAYFQSVYDVFQGVVNGKLEALYEQYDAIPRG